MEKIERYPYKYALKDEYGYTDADLVEKVNEVIDKVNKIIEELKAGKNNENYNEEES